MLKFEKKKFDEIQDFCNRFRTLAPNLLTFAARIKLMAESLERNDKGCIGFVYGKDYHPSMTRKQGEEYTMFEKLHITDRLKAVHKDTSVFENLLQKLDEIKATKDWSYKETGENFALLLDPDKAMDEIDKQIALEGESEKMKQKRNGLLRRLGSVM